MLEVTQSEYGFVGEMHQDGDGNPFLRTYAISNLAWNDETRVLFEKYKASGLEFSNLNNLFGAAIKTQTTVIANDASRHPEANGTPPGHPPLNHFLGLPIKLGNEMVGLLGMANRPGGYTGEIARWLEPFTAITAGIIVGYRNLKARERIERERDSYLNHSSAVHVVCDPEGNFRHANPTLVNLLGRSVSELSKTPFTEYFHPEDLNRTNLAFADILKGKGVHGFENRYLSADGTYHWLEWSAPAADQETGMVYATAMDTTERRRLHAELQLLALMAKRTNNSIILTDARGRIEWMNEGFM